MPFQSEICFGNRLAQACDLFVPEFQPSIPICWPCWGLIFLYCGMATPEDPELDFLRSKAESSFLSRSFRKSHFRAPVLAAETPWQ